MPILPIHFSTLHAIFASKFDYRFWSILFFCSFFPMFIPIVGFSVGLMTIPVMGFAFSVSEVITNNDRKRIRLLLAGMVGFLWSVMILGVCYPYFDSDVFSTIFILWCAKQVVTVAAYGFFSFFTNVDVFGKNGTDSEMIVMI